jgi:hypothetical protein
MVTSLHEHLRDLLLCHRTGLNNPVHDKAAQISTLCIRARKLASVYIWLCFNAPSCFFHITIWISVTACPGALQYYQPSREDGVYLRVAPQRSPSMVLGLSYPE